jgi:hypothetical protein
MGSARATGAGAQETAMVDRRTSAMSRKPVNLFITYLLVWCKFLQFPGAVHNLPLTDLNVNGFFNCFEEISPGNGRIDEGISLLAISRGVQPLLFLSKPDFLVGNLILAEKVAFESGKCALLNGGMYLVHQPGDKAQVMYGSQPVGK